MPYVAILSADPRLDDLLRPSGLATRRIDPADPAAGQAPGDSPQAIVADARGLHQLPSGLAAFRRQHPSAGLVVAATAFDPALMMDAMRAGAKECVVEPLTAASLEEAVRRVIVDAAQEPAGQMIAFVGAKGGVGTTTLAVNVAAALARGGDALLIDLHVGQGDVAVFLGAEPRFSIVDALENVHRLDDSFASGVIEKTKGGLHLLASSDRVLHAPVDGQRTRRLLEFALRRYRCTVLDVPRADAGMLDALEPATAIVVVAAQEVSSLRSGARLAQGLRHRYGHGRVKLVLNRFDGRSEIGRADVERVLGESVHLIPSDYRLAVAAMNQGHPVVLEKRSRLAQAFVRLARELTGAVKEKPAVERSAGMLSRLAWRRA